MLLEDEREAFLRYLEGEVSYLSSTITRMQSLPTMRWVASRHRIQLAAYRIVLDEMRRKDKEGKK